MVDYDYIDKLNDSEKEFLAKFSSEYYGASIPRDKKTRKIKRSESLHQTKKQVKEIYDDNNRRNNDMYGVSRANHLLSPITRNSDNSYNVDQIMQDKELPEDALIAEIDSKRLAEKIESVMEIASQFLGPRRVKEWLVIPVPMFGDKTPEQMLETMDDSLELEEFITQLATGLNLEFNYFLKVALFVVRSKIIRNRL